MFKSRMGPLGVVKADPFLNDPLGLEAVLQFRQVNRLLFQRSPEALDEDVVQIAPSAIHRDPHIGLGQRCDPVCSGKLAALIGVYNLGWAIWQ